MASITLKHDTDYKPANKTTSILENAAPVHVVLRPSVVVAIPCYNEEVSIGSVVLRARAHADRVVVIDDGSKDNTAEIARLAGAEVITHGTNQGKGAGIKNAFNHARAVNADILVLLDGDGQHCPDEIPLLIEPIARGEADMVNGSRFLEKNNNHVPRYRRLGQEILTMLTNTGAGKSITDSQSGFRAFARHTFDSFSFKQAGMAIESEMLIDAAKSELRVKEVQINVRYDVNGSTYNPVVHGFSVMKSVLKMILQRNQTLAYGLPGLVLLLAGAGGFSFVTLGTPGISANLQVGFAALSMLSAIIGALCIFMVLTFKSIEKASVKT